MRPVAGLASQALPGGGIWCSLQPSHHPVLQPGQESSLLPCTAGLGRTHSLKALKCLRFEMGAHLCPNPALDRTEPPSPFPRVHQGAVPPRDAPKPSEQAPGDAEQSLCRGGCSVLVWCHLSGTVSLKLLPPSRICPLAGAVAAQGPLAAATPWRSSSYMRQGESWKLGEHLGDNSDHQWQTPASSTPLWQRGETPPVQGSF